MRENFLKLTERRLAGLPVDETLFEQQLQEDNEPLEQTRQRFLAGLTSKTELLFEQAKTRSSLLTESTQHGETDEIIKWRQRKIAGLPDRFQPSRGESQLE